MLDASSQSSVVIARLPVRPPQTLSAIARSPGTGTPFSVRVDAASRRTRSSSRRRNGVPHVGRAVGIAEGRAELDAVTRVGLDGECKKAARRQDCRDGRHDGDEVAHIDEHIGGEHEMVLRLVGRFVAQERHEIGGGQPVVQPLLARLLDHRGRDVDAHQPIHEWPERHPAQAGAAAEIQHGTEAERLRHTAHRLEQELRPAIAEVLQHGIEAGRMLIEQAAHVGGGHLRCGLAGAEPRQMEPRAVIVLRVGRARLLERGDRARAVPQHVADRAQCEPRGRERGRELQGLHQKVGRADKIAALGVVDRPLVTAVGDQVAGGDKERCHRAPE